MRFLKKLHRSGRLEPLEVDGLLVLIQFLYGYAKEAVLLYRFPVYVATLTMYLTTMLYFESIDFIAAF